MEYLVPNFVLMLDFPVSSDVLHFLFTISQCIMCFTVFVNVDFISSCVVILRRGYFLYHLTGIDVS